MPPRWIALSLLILSGYLGAQPPAAKPAASPQQPVQVGALPFDRAKVAAAIHDSYYHPDKLPGLDCTVSFDWPAFFAAAKLTPSEKRAKTMESLKIHSHAPRNKTAVLTYDWAGGELDTKQQMEDGIRQIVTGFYQVYWPMVASSPAGDAHDLTRIEPQPGGGANATFVSQGMTVVMTIDKDNLPTHYTLDSPSLKGTIDTHYVASPTPAAGDLHRVSRLEVTEQIGSSTLNVALDLSYRALDGFNVPKRVTLEIVGAYAIPMDFTECSVSK